MDVAPTMIEDHVMRLLWAFPLVLLFGVLFIYWLKRTGLGSAPQQLESDVPSLISSLNLTENSRVIVMQYRQQQYLVFESSEQLSVQAFERTQMQAGQPLAGRGTMPLWFVKDRSS